MFLPICNSPASLRIARAPEDLNKKSVRVHKSDGRVPASEYDNILADVRCPADFTRIKQMFTCGDVYIKNYNRHHHYSKETGC